MTNLYDKIVKGIEGNRSIGGGIETYLQSLKPAVRMLRSAYRKHPVYVPYEKENIQSAYLIAYLPHYYQLIEKVLREQNPDTLSNKTSINITFIGGGPGSEVYGAVKHVLANNKNLKTIRITILDINAETWGYSHKIVRENLIGELPSVDDVEIQWEAYPLNLIDHNSVSSKSDHISKSDLVVVQNCINEIAQNHFLALSKSPS